MKAMAPPTLSVRTRQTSSATARQIARSDRFWKTTSESGLVVILPRMTTTAIGTNRLSVPSSEIASNPVTSAATRSAASTQTGRGKLVISSTGRCIARKAITRKTSEPSRLFISSSTS
jgi:hypothetical protein